MEVYYIKRTKTLICYRHGAEEVGSSEQPEKPSPSKFAFRGAGYRLGETEDDPTDVVHGAPMMQEARKVKNKPDKFCTECLILNCALMYSHNRDIADSLVPYHA